jgi:multidrug efflux pump
MRLYGEQQEQIGIYIDRDRLSDYGLNTATLLSATCNRRG